MFRKSFKNLLLTSCFSLGLNVVSYSSTDVFDIGNNSSRVRIEQAHDNLEALSNAIRGYSEVAKKLFDEQLNQLTITNLKTAVDWKSYHRDAQSMIKNRFSKEDKFLDNALIILKLLSDLKNYEIIPENLKPKPDSNYHEESWIQYEQMSGEFYLNYNISSLLGLVSGADRNGKTQLRLNRLQEIPKQLKKPATETPMYGMPPTKDNNAHFFNKGVELEKNINEIFKNNNITNLTNLEKLSQDILAFFLQTPDMHLEAQFQKSYFEERYISLHGKLVRISNNNQTHELEVKSVDDIKNKIKDVEIKLQTATEKADIMARIKQFVDEILAAIKKQGHIS